MPILSQNEANDKQILSIIDISLKIVGLEPC